MPQFKLSFICLISLLLHVTILSQPLYIYPYETWMSSFPSSSTNIYNKTIFDIILPGSRSAGMIYDDISTNEASGANNFFSYSRIETLSDEDKKLWSCRQHLSILNQLRSGSRFLTFEIEENNNNYYPFNALLSNHNINSIINEIDTFILNYGNNEIIILYFNSFQVNSLQNFYNLFNNSNLNSKMVPISVDLKTETLQNIIDNGYNIIAFSDDLNVINVPNTFFDSHEYLYIADTTSSTNNITRGYISDINELRTFITSSLRYGWPLHHLNLIYWTFDITPIGAFTQVTDYKSFYEYNMAAAFELHTLIKTYSKLRFGNIILVDFLHASDVVQQAILLNLEYVSCFDRIPMNNNISGCPSQTSLEINFKYNSISSVCSNNNNLNMNCKRSCGECPFSTNVPGANCSSSSECNSILYSSYGSGTTNGECFIRQDSESRYIEKKSFCLSLSGGYVSCDNFDGNDICRNNDNDYYSECDDFCSANYECSDGYCNSQYSICMSLNDNTSTNTTTTTATDINNDEKYSGIVSERASLYRDEVNVFRSGDSDALYPSGENDLQCSDYSTKCFFENLDANPYISSVLGLLLLIIILCILFCVCFSICCPFWCFCDRYCKTCCCTPIYGKIEKQEWSVFKEWCPCISLLIIMIIVLAFTIEGIISNTSLHSHIFDNEDENSFVYASNQLFDDVESKFGSANNLTEFILQNIENILNAVDNKISDGNDTQAIKDNINKMYDELNIMHNNYSAGISLSGEVINPFNLSIINNYTLVCDYCDTIPERIISVNDTLSSSSSSTLNDLSTTLNSTSIFVNYRDTINDATEQFRDSIAEILDISNSTQIRYNEYMDLAEKYDAERQTYVTLFFCLMFLFIIFPLIGILIKSKWCFKINWCLAMICTILLLFISLPFVFIITLSADFCVRLDEFESALPYAMNTKLGVSIFNNSAAVIDDTSAYDINDTLDLIDTCFDGGSLLDVFNLSHILDWTSYKNELYDSLDFDVKQFLTIDELQSFETEINTVTVSEYVINVDEEIDAANAIPGCYCIEENNTFTWENLNPGTQCTPVDPYTGNISQARNYWSNIIINVNVSTCAEAFRNASYAVQIWNSSGTEGHLKIETLKREAAKLFNIHDIIYDQVNELTVKLQNITCLINPLFDDFDKILNEFTNCGFLGERYGDFKKVSCVTIFTDFYKIGRAIVIIAFMCLLIVLFSLCLDYVYAPWKPKDVDDDENEAYYVADVDKDGSGGDLELQTTSQISPGNYLTEPDGFDRVVSSSNSPGAAPYAAINNDNNNNNEIDEMDGAVTGDQINNNDEDEFPVLPNENNFDLANNNNSDAHEGDEFPILPDENQENDGDQYTIPQNDNEEFAD